MPVSATRATPASSMMIPRVMIATSALWRIFTALAPPTHHLLFLVALTAAVTASSDTLGSIAVEGGCGLGHRQVPVAGQHDRSDVVVGGIQGVDELRHHRSVVLGVDELDGDLHAIEQSGHVLLGDDLRDAAYRRHRLARVGVATDPAREVAIERVVQALVHRIDDRHDLVGRGRAGRPPTGSA